MRRINLCPLTFSYSKSHFTFDACSKVCLSVQALFVLETRTNSSRFTSLKFVSTMVLLNLNQNYYRVCLKHTYTVIPVFNKYDLFRHTLLSSWDFSVVYIPHVFLLNTTQQFSFTDFLIFYFCCLFT